MNHFKNSNSPIVVGGVGGSGTRVIAQMLIEAGVYMGDKLNEPNDNLWFTLLFRRPKWKIKSSDTEQLKLLEIFHKKMMGENKFSLNQKIKIYSAVIEFIRYKYIRKNDWASLPLSIANSMLNSTTNSTDKKIWGWKEPNTIFYIPMLAKKYPMMKYLLVLRNGLDMGFTKNLVQIRNFGSSFGINGNSPADLLEFWIRANNKTIEDGKIFLGDRFKILHLEEMCKNPEHESAELLKWAGINYDDRLLKKISSLPQKSSSTDRFKKEDLSVFSKQQVQFVQQLGYNLSI